MSTTETENLRRARERVNAQRQQRWRGADVKRAAEEARLEYDRIVRERERRTITGVPQSTWYVLMQKGLAPRGVPLGPRAVGYVLSELLAFNAERIAARDRASA